MDGLCGTQQDDPQLRYTKNRLPTCLYRRKTQPYWYKHNQHNQHNQHNNHNKHNKYTTCTTFTTFTTFTTSTTSTTRATSTR